MPAWASGRRSPLRRRLRISRGTWVLVAGGLGVAVIFALLPDPPIGLGTSLAGPVERVADGDTLEIGGQRLRLVGLDAPEWDQACTAAAGQWPCGRAATERMRELVRGQVLNCRGTGHDQYGRLLATCTVDGSDIGEALVRDGLAVAAGRYAAAESEAKAARRGLWQGDFVSPARWRAERGDTGAGQGNPSRFERFLAWLAGLFGS